MGYMYEQPHKLRDGGDLESEKAEETTFIGRVKLYLMPEIDQIGTG